jgi:pimeloyl-ACP methyl ester carboxylesterase
MLIRQVIRYVCITAMFLGSIAVYAEEVSLPYKGLTLNGNLLLAPGKQLHEGVVLVTHGGLAHYGMETIVSLQGLLKEAGYSSLAINLSLGLDNRRGMYDCKQTHRHRHDDAVDEIDAWINWLKKQGVRKVTLLGHSRGGGQTALYAAERDNDLVNAVVLMAPQTSENGGAGYRQRYNQPLAPILEKAQALVKNGKGKTVLTHANILFCRDVSATAESFVSYYGPDPRLDTPSLIPNIRKPVLVVVAEEDEVVRGLDRKIVPLPRGNRMQMNVISGSDHFFRDLYADDAVDAIDVFLTSVNR